jgi:hypothetical protein
MLPCNKVEVSNRHHSPCAIAAGIMPKLIAKLLMPPSKSESKKMLIQVTRIARVTFGTVLNEPPNLVLGSAT